MIFWYWYILFGISQSHNPIRQWYEISPPPKECVFIKSTTTQGVLNNYFNCSNKNVTRQPLNP